MDFNHFVQLIAIGLQARIPMHMTAANLALALGLAAAVSFISALLTVGKLRRADPAELF